MHSQDYIQLSNIILPSCLHWIVQLITPIIPKPSQMAKLVHVVCPCELAITFLNTSSVMNIKPLCTSVALMDNCFRRIAEVEVTESWSHMGQAWTAIGNTDT